MFFNESDGGAELAGLESGHISAGAGAEDCDIEVLIHMKSLLSVMIDKERRFICGNNRQIAKIDKVVIE
jgi:hypothetical protein